MKAKRSKEWVQLYVTWELRERLRMRAKAENRKMVAIIEEMLNEREKAPERISGSR